MNIVPFVGNPSKRTGTMKRLITSGYGSELHKEEKKESEKFKRHVQTFDSADREDPTNSTPSEYFITHTERIDIVQMELLSAEIPNSEHVINATNNLIEFKHANDPGFPLPLTATLTPGTYTGPEIANEINLQMNAAMGAAIGVEVNVTFNTITKLLTITGVTGNIELLFGPLNPDTLLDNPSFGNSPTTQLGFLAVNTAAAASATSNSIVNLSGEDYIYMQIVFPSGLTNVIQTTNNIPNVFAKIILNVPPDTVSFYSYVSNPLKFKPSYPRIRRLGFRFVKHDGTLYDFQSVNHSFTIEYKTKKS